jgi:hypothetical protein
MTGMRFSVEPWAPEYGSPMRAPDVDLEIRVNLQVETPAADWAPVAPEPEAGRAESVAFIDGARRVDARIWIRDADGAACQGVCASWAAGATVCEQTARVAAIRVERGLFCSDRRADSITTEHGTFLVHHTAKERPDELVGEVHAKMTELEVKVASDLPPVELVVFDGPLGKHRTAESAVGYIKTHHVQYGGPTVQETVAALGVGQRTPLFVASGTWERLSWYVRLPGEHDHPWSGVVRVEAATGRSRDEAVRLADRVTATLGRFASRGFQDPRAPQNLLPIGALERELHHRMGDRGLFLRALRRAAGISARAA